MAISSAPGNIGWKASDFDLTDTFGIHRNLDAVRGQKGLVLMFICNHCPYVKAIIDRICRDAAELQTMGIGVAAVMSNDTHAYPEDSFANMQKLAKTLNFPFPYLYDPTQHVARDYGAVCTPDFFGFNGALELQYRGRLDSCGKEPATPELRHELLEAMRLIAEGRRGPADQFASIGCSIKWKS